MKHSIYGLLLSILIISCDKDTPIPQVNAFTQFESAAPFTLTSSTALFYENIEYDTDQRNVFDYFKPNEGTPSGLFLYIHGGGFITGDKSNLYGSNVDFINRLLDNNIAVASINYRLVGFNDSEGVLKSLRDSKRALQYIRYHADDLNLNKSKIVLGGGSAGAGTSLWIGLQDDLSDTSNPDPILQESTRVQGMVCIETQATYDLLEWHNSIFSPYQADGFNFQAIEGIVTSVGVYAYLGLPFGTAYNDPSITAVRQKVDMLSFMSSDDPELYALNINVANILPTDTDELYHHPLHIKALQDAAATANVAGIFYSPNIDIDTRNGEDIDDFIIRKVGE